MFPIAVGGGCVGVLTLGEGLQRMLCEIAFDSITAYMTLPIGMRLSMPVNGVRCLHPALLIVCRCADHQRNGRDPFRSSAGNLWP